MEILNNTNYLQHHGIKGMHWGIRRFQNKDRTSTTAGKARRKKKNHETAKRIARGIGILALEAGAAYGIHKISRKVADRVVNKRNFANTATKVFQDGPTIVKRATTSSSASSINRSLNTKLNEIKRQAANTKASTLNSHNWKDTADFTQDLLRKNGHSLAGFTMSDLRDLDLY